MQPNSICDITEKHHFGLPHQHTYHRQGMGMQFLLGKPVLSSQLLLQSCLLRVLFTGSAMQTIDCQGSSATAPRCWHLKTYLLSYGFSNHTRQQGEGGIRLPPQHLSMKSSRNPHSMLAFFQLGSTDQNLVQSGCPVMCNKHVYPAMTNGLSEIVPSPASETAFEMSLTCHVLSSCYKNSSATLAGAACPVNLDS